MSEVASNENSLSEAGSVEWHLSQAKQKLLADGNEKFIRPETVVISELPPKELDSWRRVMQLKGAFGGVSVSEDEQTRQLKDAVDYYGRLAAKGQIRRALALGLVAGVASGAYMTSAIGEKKYILRQGLDMVPDHVAGQLLPNNVLTAEQFIPLGNTGYQIPNPLTLTYGELRVHEIKSTEAKTVEGSTIPKLAHNPVAQDLKLTGQEFAIDAETAKVVLDKIKNDNGNVTSVAVEGIASDEFKGELGKKNPEQDQLAKDRARVAVEALKSVAKLEGVTLPADIKVLSSESVQAPEMVTKVGAMAKSLGMSTADMIQRYNAGEKLSVEAAALLDSALIRGANYTVGYDKEVTKSEYTLAPGGTKQDSWKPWMSFGLFGLIGYPVAAVKLGLSMRGSSRRRRKIAQKDLKEQVKQAELFKKMPGVNVARK